MNDPAHIFVGTMYTNEGDFQKCIEQIQAQEGVIVSHHLISGMKEKEAHNALWRAWRQAQSTHDLFVKIDADTVLASDRTLQQLSELFRNNSRLTAVQCPLHDYMTDGFINGLNAFSPRVIFNDTNDELYCDRVDTGHDQRLQSNQVPDYLRPAGFHCHYANEIQAFHYGVHRALKGQREIMNKVRIAWNYHGDEIRAYALIGEMMSSRFIMNRKFNYADVELQEAFEEAKSNYSTFIEQLSGR